MVHDYGKEFYERAISQEGVDYNFYGDWQKSYAKMVISITNILKAASDNRNSMLLDIGCACGVTLRGFKETKVFNRCVGVDISDYMLDLGKETHSFNDSEMIKVDITEEPLPFDDNSVTLLNCSHVLEHIPEDKLDFVMDEFHRVLEPETGYGFIVIPAIKPGNPKSEVEREESHVNIQTMNWWRVRLAKRFTIDNSIRKAFKESEFSPVMIGGTEEERKEKNFYSFYNAGWTLFGLRKEK